MKRSPELDRDVMTRLAQQHPLCQTNVTAYAGQTATMYCCLARLERDLSVSIAYLVHLLVHTLYEQHLRN